MFIYTIVFNIVQGNFVTPLVYGKAVSLHPAIVLLAVPIGNALAGIVGMFLVVPVAGVIATIRRAWSCRPSMVGMSSSRGRSLMPRRMTWLLQRHPGGRQLAMDGSRRPRRSLTRAILAARAAAAFLADRHRPRRRHCGPWFRHRRHAVRPGRDPVRGVAHGVCARTAGPLAGTPSAVPLTGARGRRDVPGDGARDVRRAAWCRRCAPERRRHVRGAAAGDRHACARAGGAPGGVARADPTRSGRPVRGARGPGGRAGRPSRMPLGRPCGISSRSSPGCSRRS